MMLISLISFSIFIAGCENEKIVEPTNNTISTQTQKPSSNTVAPSNSTINTNPSATNNNKSSSSNKVIYKLTKVIYKIKNITISYPKVTGLTDSNKQNKINTLIKDDALYLVNAGNYPIDNVGLDINYTVKLSNSNLLSIIYTGESSIKGSSHPNNEFYTTNINVENSTKLKLSDFTSIDKGLAESFKNGKYIVPAFENNKELQLEVMSYVKGMDDTSLINDFKQRDTDYPGCSYLTKDSIGISTSLPHAIGDHAECEINIKNINTKNKLLEKLINPS